MDEPMAMAQKQGKVSTCYRNHSGGQLEQCATMRVTLVEMAALPVSGGFQGKRVFITTRCRLRRGTNSLYDQ